jgi:hypothetical protein
MIVEFPGGMIRGFVIFELFVIVIDKYVLVLFRKTQYDPKSTERVPDGSVIDENRLFVIL